MYVCICIYIYIYIYAYIYIYIYSLLYRARDSGISYSARPPCCLQAAVEAEELPAAEECASP